MCRPGIADEQRLSLCRLRKKGLMTFAPFFPFWFGLTRVFASRNSEVRLQGDDSVDLKSGKLTFWNFPDILKLLETFTGHKCVIPQLHAWWETQQVD